MPPSTLLRAGQRLLHARVPFHNNYALAALVSMPSTSGRDATTHWALRHRSDVTTTGDQLSLVGRNLLVDTLDLVRETLPVCQHTQPTTNSQFRRLERAGLSPQQAQALADEIRELLCVTKEKIQDSCASKAVLRESILEQEARIAGFKSEVLKSQELSAATFSRDTERLQSSLDKIKTEVRYEIDKLTASQRLDLNLEKGRMRDELQAVRDKASEMEVKVDKDINGLKAMIEQTKNELFRYFMGMLIGLLGVGLGLARMLF